jgi:hypothetical protein
MPSKLVTDRQKSAQAVIAAARTHGPRITDTVASTLAPFVKKGEKQPDIGMVLELSARALDQAIDAAVEADVAHETELADDDGFRKARDEKVAALYEAIGELKEVAVGLLGRGVTKVLRLDGTTSRDAVVLARYAGEVATALESAKLPKPRVRGAKFHADEWAEKLRADAKALTQAVNAVTRETREAEATLVAKNRALDAYDSTFTNVATIVSGLLRMGGDPEIAARVRPSARRPGQTVEVAEGSESINPEEPAPTTGTTTVTTPTPTA